MSLLTIPLLLKPTTVTDALNKWEQKTKEKRAEAKWVDLHFQFPPIEKLDASLSTLQECEKLSLSTNAIEKISNLNGLKNLKILSLGRNNLKSLQGLEPVGDTLEQLWISYNSIEKLRGITVLKKLKILYMSNNMVRDWSEFNRMSNLPELTELVFVGNPLEERYLGDAEWSTRVAQKLTKLKKLDGVPVIRDDDESDDEDTGNRTPCKTPRSPKLAPISMPRSPKMAPGTSPKSPRIANTAPRSPKNPPLPKSPRNPNINA